MRKKLAVAASAALLAGLCATSSAFAGEVKGPPGPGGASTPIRSGVSASLCAFSGLNDYVQGQTITQTQNWGQDTRLGIIEGPSPSIGCNPTRTSAGG
jgi:hypothetical protein